MIRRLLITALMVVAYLSAAMAQGGSAITGTVTNDTGEPLAGATVSIPGTKSAVATDINGKFKLNLPKGLKAKELLVTYIGMNPARYALAKISSPLTVKMVSSSTNLDDIIVTGYTTISKERATGSFGSVSAKKLDAKIGGDLVNRLEGQVAGDDDIVGLPTATASLPSSNSSIHALTPHSSTLPSPHSKAPAQRVPKPWRPTASARLISSPPSSAPP